jgi:hypothetical protein
MKVRYIGATKEQVQWGGNDDPRDYLELNGIYTLARCETHTWHTKFYLKEFPGMKFNSVCFEEVDGMADTYRAAQKEKEAIVEILRMYRDAADKFINKVESGRARSMETYAEMKACKEAYLKYFGE